MERERARARLQQAARPRARRLHNGVREGERLAGGDEDLGRGRLRSHLHRHAVDHRIRRHGDTPAEDERRRRRKRARVALGRVGDLDGDLAGQRTPPAGERQVGQRDRSSGMEAAEVALHVTVHTAIETARRQRKGRHKEAVARAKDVRGKGEDALVDREHGPARHRVRQRRGEVECSAVGERHLRLAHVGHLPERQREAAPHAQLARLRKRELVGERPAHHEDQAAVPAHGDRPGTDRRNLRVDPRLDLQSARERRRGLRRQPKLPRPGLDDADRTADRALELRLLRAMQRQRHRLCGRTGDRARPGEVRQHGVGRQLTHAHDLLGPSADGAEPHHNRARPCAHSSSVHATPFSHSKKRNNSTKTTTEMQV